MIIVLKNSSDQKRIDALTEKLKAQGFHIHYSEGKSTTILGLVEIRPKWTSKIWRPMKSLLPLSA